MFSSFLKILLIVPFIVVMSIITTVVVVLTRSPIVFDSLVRFFYSGILVLSSVKVKVVGLEGFDASRNYIYVANHSSYYDIPSVMTGIPDKFIRIMYKKELQKIPVFGWAMKWTRFYIPINRGRGMEAQQSLEKAIERIKNGESVLLFAEGTRTTDGNLQQFKRGAFNIAVKSGIPVVPVTINGSYRIMPKGSLQIRSGEITLVVGKPILPPAENGKSSELQLMEEVHQSLSKNFIAQ
ncbi:MAG: 1-acyl-sn-glycerol-3-phosphate acyltransferase [Ignavibacteriae bacterium]|nr:1-acyl-sn-glycerol-3-phosphate acyltransferase [Ignavibacteriota bacterium]